MPGRRHRYARGIPNLMVRHRLSFSDCGTSVCVSANHYSCTMIFTKFDALALQLSRIRRASPNGMETFEVLNLYDTVSAFPV
jgi:hypothetical protein